MSVLHARIQREMLAAEHARLVEQALRESSDHTVAPRSAAGDGERLRGIPAIGRGVSGEIRGTRPGVSRRLGSWSGH